MMEMSKKMYSNKSQQGIVLVVSLLILLVLSIIGISAISNTGMEERMSNNFQQSMMAFQASESAINEVILRGDKEDADYSDARNADGISADPLIAASEAGLNATTTTITYDADPNNNMVASVTSTATVSFRGQGDACFNDTSAEGWVCSKFEITTDTSIGGSITGSQHIQGIDRPTPSGS